MPDNNYFVHPDQVSSFGFDWGQLALTVGPEVNGAKTFSGGVVDLPAGQGHRGTITPAPRRSSS